METARRAAAADLPAVVRLVSEFVAEQRDQRGGAVWVAQQGHALCDIDARRAAIDDPARLTLLGGIDDVPVGLVLGHLDTLDDGSTLAVIDALYVEPDARAVGVGSAMLDAVVAWAADAGARGVDATVLPGNRGGKNFFEMHGLVARAIRFCPRGGGGVTPGPQLCVGAVVVLDGALLLVQRATAPGAGMWSVPGGRVELGETLVEAVVRELAEETGLEGICGELIGVVERFDDDVDPGHFVILDYRVTVIDDEQPRAATDAADARWVPLEDVAEMLLVDGLAEFLHEHGILRTIV